MPPFVSRNRHRTATPPSQNSTPKKKPTLFETADQDDTKRSVDANRKLIEQLDASSDSDSLSEVESSDFEDVLPRKKQKLQLDESDDDMDWEDALPPTTPVAPGPEPSGELELTLSKGQNYSSLTDPRGSKKGPSKIERQIRVATHQMHVQFLMFHHALRNGWACDKQVQDVLVKQLPAFLVQQVKIWRKASALPEDGSTVTQPHKKGKGRAARDKQRENYGSQRDWGKPAVRQEEGAPNMSQGDPLFKLLKNLTVYWKRTFRVTAPSLRKQGYKPMSRLQDEIASFHNDHHDPQEHGERIEGKKGLLACAKKLEGSRDVGAQLFTALLRGLSIESRLVASLQPVGFGWSKAEEAVKKKRVQQMVAASSSSDGEDEESEGERNEVNQRLAEGKSKSKPKPTSQASSKRCQPKRGARDAPINLDGSSSELSDPPSDVSDDHSVEELKMQVATKPKSNLAYDRDLTFPNTWIEAISPITHKVIPIDPVVTQTVVSNEDHLAAFEPRGKQADKAKQVLAYVVAYSADGSAKDVTTRYLKRRMWPGRTKGFRMPVEKIAVKNRQGKVKGYGYHDWFKRVMSGYSRADADCTVADAIEDATDLVAVRPEKKKADVGTEIETLQGYKQSAHFVLERFLRREEALLPGAEPLRMFPVPGKKGESPKEEPVYRRADVVPCKTAESWHKEGRCIKVGEQPLKNVPIRAVTLARKLEVEAAAKESGTRPMQGMYAADQTEYIVPPPIENGVIPKNAFGTIDCFVPSMVPQGAAHVPYRGTVRVCKRLGIDFAEAVTGFEFGNRRAVPVTQGVVVAEEYEQQVMDELLKDEEERKAKEDGKREKLALAIWKKFFIGLRIIERVRAEYGDEGQERDEVNPFTNPNRHAGKADSPRADGGGAGFVPDGDVEDESGGFVIEE